MQRVCSVLIAVMMLLGLAATAEAKTVRYHSQHPIPQRLGGGFCYIGQPHVHGYPPSDGRLYRQRGDEYYFVGDPTPFGYEGPQYTYYGAHPIVDVDAQFEEPVYCYLEGPHYHWYQPTATAQFELRGGAYWYVGPADPVFYRQRSRYVVINQAYRPIQYARPVVDVTVAPPAASAYIVASPPGVYGRAVVAPPAVDVHVAVPPPPSVHFGVSVGAPPPPVVRERVIIAQPPPPGVIVVHGHAHGHWHHGHRH